MADSWGTPETYSTDPTEVDVVPDEAGRIQEDKVNKKKLAELEEDGKMAQIYVRASKKSGLIPYTGVKNIPLNVATVCISSFFDHFHKKRRDYFIIEDSNLEPYKFIFEWVKQCGEEKGVANLPEVKDMANSETGLKPFIDIMIIAAKLKIPTASFNKFMVKKLTFMARDYLIDLPIVSRIFDSGDAEVYDLGLQEVAATSIFSHWYDYKLEDPEFDDYMEELTEMRKNIVELDEALHKAVEDKDAWLKNKRQERRDKQAEEAASGAAGWDNSNGDNAEASGFGADSGWTNAAETSGSGGDGSWAETTEVLPAFGASHDWVNQVPVATGEWD